PTASALHIDAPAGDLVSLVAVALPSPAPLRRPALSWNLSAGIPRPALSPKAGGPHGDYQPRRRHPRGQSALGPSGAFLALPASAPGRGCLGRHKQVYPGEPAPAVPGAAPARRHSQRRRFAAVRRAGASTGQPRSRHSTRSIRLVPAPP